MPSWQITLITVGAALLADALAVLVGRAPVARGRDRRRRQYHDRVSRDTSPIQKRVICARQPAPPAPFHYRTDSAIRHGAGPGVRITFSDRASSARSTRMPVLVRGGYEVGFGDAGGVHTGVICAAVRRRAGSLTGTALIWMA